MCLYHWITTALPIATFQSWFCDSNLQYIRLHDSKLDYYRTFKNDFWESGGGKGMAKNPETYKYQYCTWYIIPSIAMHPMSCNEHLYLTHLRQPCMPGDICLYVDFSASASISPLWRVSLSSICCEYFLWLASCSSFTSFCVTPQLRCFTLQRFSEISPAIQSQSIADTNGIALLIDTFQP